MFCPQKDSTWKYFFRAINSKGKSQSVPERTNVMAQTCFQGVHFGLDLWTIPLNSPHRIAGENAVLSVLGRWETVMTFCGLPLCPRSAVQFWTVAFQSSWSWVTHTHRWRKYGKLAATFSTGNSEGIVTENVCYRCMTIRIDCWRCQIILTNYRANMKLSLQSA